MFKRFRLRTFALAGVAAIAVPAMGFLTTTSAQAADGNGYGDFKGKVIATSLNSRSWPTPAAAKVWTYKKGAVITFMCKLNAVSVDGNRRWYMIGAGSYVSARYVSNVGKTPTWCPETKFDVAKAVKKPSVNLRRGPTNASKIVGSLKYGTKVELICKVNGPKVDGNPRWYQLRDGRWVTARYMQNVGEAPRFCSEKAP
jgi:uncharacterized protein YgiM (DUF1202 family)